MYFRQGHEKYLSVFKQPAPWETIPEIGAMEECLVTHMKVWKIVDMTYIISLYALILCSVN